MSLPQVMNFFGEFSQERSEAGIGVNFREMPIDSELKISPHCDIDSEVSFLLSMKKDSELSQNNFDTLLNWLASDREEAGEKYEQIREGLIRFFRFRGCSDPATLADETINRVASKVSTFTFDGQIKIISFFYGFASNIYLEYVSRRKKIEIEFEPNLAPVSTKPADSERPDEDMYVCLESCLGKLQVEENKLVVTYYSREKSARLALRRELADTMNLRAGALHTRIYRIRNVLKLCIEDCLHEKNP